MNAVSSQPFDGVMNTQVDVRQGHVSIAIVSNGRIESALIGEQSPNKRLYPTKHVEITLCVGRQLEIGRLGVKRRAPPLEEEIDQHANFVVALILDGLTNAAPPLVSPPRSAVADAPVRPVSARKRRPQVRSAWASTKGAVRRQQLVRRRATRRNPRQPAGSGRKVTISTFTGRADAPGLSVLVGYVGGETALRVRRPDRSRENPAPGGPNRASPSGGFRGSSMLSD